LICRAGLVVDIAELPAHAGDAGKARAALHGALARSIVVAVALSILAAKGTTGKGYALL
jgi:hypothetical protein